LGLVCGGGAGAWWSDEEVEGGMEWVSLFELRRMRGRWADPRRDIGVLYLALAHGGGEARMGMKVRI